MNAIKRMFGVSEFVTAYFIVSLLLVSAAGYVTNVVWFFQQSGLGEIILGAFGIIIMPIGILHGVNLWF